MKLKNSILLQSAIVAFVTCSSAHAQHVWDAGGDGVNWNSINNWNPNTTPANKEITFNNTVTGALDTTIGATYSVASLNFTSAQTSSVIIRTDNSKPLTLSGTVTTDISVQAGSHTFIGTNGGPSTKDFIFTKGTTNVINIASGASFAIQARLGQTDTTTAIYRKTGSGTFVLAGDNGGSGSWNIDNTGNSGKGFSIEEGALRFAATRAFGNSGNTFTVATGAALEITGGVNQSISTGTGTITLNGTGLGGTGALRSLSGGNSFSMSAGATGGIILASDSSVGVDADSLTISQMISQSGGARSLTKVGAGTLTLSNTGNSYNGATIVSAGTLNITGSTASGSAVSVGGSAASGSPRLAGSGTVNGSVTVKSAGGGAAGILNAGNSTLTNKVGTFNLGSALEFENGSTFEWDLGVSKDANGLGGDDGIAGTDFDSVSVTGSITAASGSIFKVVFSSTVLNDITTGNAFWNTPNASRTWNMSAIFGKTFASLSDSFTVVETSSAVASYGSFSITNSTLTWTPIPEPSTALGGLLLTAGLLRRRRNARTPGLPS